MNEGQVPAGLGCLLAVSALLTAVPVSARAQALSRTPLAEGLSQPVFVTAPPGDHPRLFILEKPGRIRLFDGDSLRATPFLDITSLVRSVSGEMGLLGLAFHPDYEANGYFFVNYTAQPDGRTVVARYRVSSDNPDLAHPDSVRVILQVPQFQSNHNGGMLAFGPGDGYLYIGLGDGGSAGDPGNRAQHADSLLGKMLRIDVDVDSTYAIPPDNPFVATDTARHEIWAVGLRNPWRWSFDRANGDLYIADVGQNRIEELNWQNGASSGGENYGWRLKEGTACFNPSSNCDPEGVLQDPITQYAHDFGRCSITGGYVYRGCRIPELMGAYLYADYCTGEVWSLRFDGSAITDSMDHTLGIGLGSADLVSFGEDAAGEILLVGITSGTVWRIDTDGPVDSCHSCPIAITGDLNLSGQINSADVLILVNHLFKAGSAPEPRPESADVNCSGRLTSADIVYLVNFVFKSGPAPCDACSLLELGHLHR